MAGTTRLELATSAVTGQRSNQLNYVPTRQINEMRNLQHLCWFAPCAYGAWNYGIGPKERDSWLNRLQTASKFLHSRHACDVQNDRTMVLPTTQLVVTSSVAVGKTQTDVHHQNILTASTRT